MGSCDDYNEPPDSTKDGEATCLLFSREDRSSKVQISRKSFYVDYLKTLSLTRLNVFDDWITNE